MATTMGGSEPPPPGMILFLPSEQLVPVTSILYRQIPKPVFPYFLHPVLILPYPPYSFIVPLIPLVRLYDRKLEEARQTALQHPSPYVLLNQSWCTADSVAQQDDEDFALFPQVGLGTFSLRVKQKFFITVEKAFWVEWKYLTPYPPRTSETAMAKALPNPSFCVTPESLQFIVALHTAHLTPPTPNSNTIPHLRDRSSYSTVRSRGSRFFGSSTPSPQPQTPDSATSQEMVAVKKQERKSSTLNAKAAEFVPAGMRKDSVNDERELKGWVDRLVDQQVTQAVKDLSVESECKGEGANGDVQKGKDAPRPARSSVQSKSRRLKQKKWKNRQEHRTPGHRTRVPLLDFLPQWNALDLETKAVGGEDSGEAKDMSVVNETGQKGVVEGETDKATEIEAGEWGDWSNVHGDLGVEGKKMTKVKWKDLDW